MNLDESRTWSSKEMANVAFYLNNIIALNSMASSLADMSKMADSTYQIRRTCFIQKKTKNGWIYLTPDGVEVKMEHIGEWICARAQARIAYETTQKVVDFGLKLREIKIPTFEEFQKKVA